MAKFIVRSYYEYVHVVEVEADSFEEAFDKGYAISNEVGTDELEFVGYTNSEVEDECGDMKEFGG
jgi:hypothetical protein